MLKLFYAPGTCARAAHITLEETGAPFETVRLDFSKNAQRSPDYLAVNPKGRVPALVTDHGILTETPAILAFIAMTHPAARLIPEDPFAFAQMQAFNSYLCSTVHVAHAHRVRGSRWADDPAAQEAMKAKVAQNMGDCFALIEESFFAGPWVMGEAYSVADPYLFVLTGWLPGDGVEIARFPKIAAHHARMQDRPAVQRALSREALPQAA